MVLLAAGGATAAVKTAHYTGLVLTVGGTAVGEIDRTTTANNLVQKDTSDPNGDYIKVQAPFRDRAPGNGKGVHVSVSYSKNGTFCYAAGISADGGASVGCSAGWNGYGSTESRNIEDSAWWFSNQKKKFDPNSNSIRGGIHLCQSALLADPCTDNRYVGISYK
jgi:hypothetical protein